MKKLVIVLFALVVPLGASAQIGKMLGDAAKGVDQAAGAMGEAAGQAAAAGETVDAAGSAAAQAKQGVGLSDVLVQQLGVTQPQATGGAGALFALAKTQMPASDFAQVSAGVPNMDSLLAAAPALGGAEGGMAGAAMGALGGGKLGAAAQLASSFSSLGMGSGMASQFIPIVVQYLQGSAGPEAASLLQAALQ